MEQKPFRIYKLPECQVCFYNDNTVYTWFFDIPDIIIAAERCIPRVKQLSDNFPYKDCAIECLKGKEENHLFYETEEEQQGNELLKAYRLPKHWIAIYSHCRAKVWSRPPTARGLEKEAMHLLKYSRGSLFHEGPLNRDDIISCAMGEKEQFLFWTAETGYTKEITDSELYDSEQRFLNRIDKVLGK
jgi:hypothetical protein